MAGHDAHGGGGGARGGRGIEAIREKLDAIGPGSYVRSVRGARSSGDRCTISVAAPGERAISFTIDGVAVESLRLMPGDAWTDEIASRVRTAVERDRARRDAMSVLSRAPMSRRRLMRKLRDRGYDESVAGGVADDLERLGFIDDRALAESAARSMVARKPAGSRFIEMKLREKGFDGSLAREAAEGAVGARDEVEDALRLARKKSASMSASLEPDARRRRIYAMLARRGYGPDVCRATVERLGRE